MLLAMLLFVPIGTKAQQSLGDELSDNVAFEAFQQGQYQKVIKSYQGHSRLDPDDKILYLLSRLKLGEDVTKHIAVWIKENDKHPRLTLARFYQAEFYFYKGDTSRAGSYLKKVPHRELSENDRASFGFISGLISLKNRNYKAAENYFKISEKSGFSSSSELAYYQGFTKYHLGSNDEALSLFELAMNDPVLGLSSKFFIAKIQLESGNHDEVITLAQSEITDRKSRVNSGFYQMIGEAYASKEDLPKSDAYFEKAIEVHPGRPTAALYYQAGVSKFKLGNESKALVYLTEAGIGSGPYAQLSAFQLGRLHIKGGNYEKALAAFKEATSSVEKAIKEESIYQSTMLTAKLGRFTEVIVYSNDYLKQFPNGRWKNDIEDMIAQSYLRTSNYDQAIEHLESLGIRGVQQEDVYQKVTYQKGTLLFNDGRFDEAQKWFLKSLQYQVNSDLADEAHFFIGEILMQKEDYKSAISSYQRQSDLNSLSDYSLGYAYFNLRSYDQAIPHFKNASTVAPDDFQEDARLRLADCYYATKAYESALREYAKLKAGDYVLFRKGLVQKGLGKIEQARSDFSKVTAKSSWKDDAIFQNALLEFEIASFEKAEAGFSELIVNHPRSIFLSKAYLYRATTRSNTKDFPGAMTDFQHVLKNHIQSEEAFSAILGLQELKQKGVATGDIDKFIEDYKIANPEDGSLELVEFESAKSDYFDLAYKNAIPKLATFIRGYPKSRFKVEAQYYLGDSYYRTQQLEEANTVFQKQKFARSIYTGRVLNRLGNINYQLMDYQEGIESYKILLSLNLSPKDNFNALSGLMDSYFADAEYDSAVHYATAIARSEWKPTGAVRKSTYVKAKSYLKLRQYDMAKEILTELHQGTDQYAAEAGFELGKLIYLAGEYDETLELLFANVEKFGSYTEWTEKSYLLIADAYVGKQELFQAKATLRSIIQHGRNADVREEAQKRLNEIEGTVSQDTTQVKEE